MGKCHLYLDFFQLLLVFRVVAWVFEKVAIALLQTISILDVDAETQS
jgi:hypothetical protein